MNGHHIPPNIKMFLRNFLFFIISFSIIIYSNNSNANDNYVNEELAFNKGCLSGIKKQRPLFEAREKFIHIKARSAFSNYYNIFLNSKKVQLIYCVESYKMFLSVNINILEYKSKIRGFAQVVLNNMFTRGLKKLKGDEIHPYFTYNSELGKSNNFRLCRLLIGGGDPLSAMNSDFIKAMAQAQLNVDPDVQVEYYQLSTKAILKEVEEAPNIPSLSGYEAAKLERDFEKFLVPYIHQIAGDHPEKNDKEVYSDIANVLFHRPAKFESTYCLVVMWYFRALADMPGFSGDKMRELFVARSL